MSSSVPLVARMRAPFTSWLPKVWSPLPWVLNNVPIFSACGTAHAVEHFAREFQVEQRINQQRVLAVDDQTGIAVSPASVWLKPRVAAVAEIVQTLGEVPLAHVLLPVVCVVFLLRPGAVVTMRS